MKLILGWVGLTVTVLAVVAILPGLSVDWSPGLYCAIAAGFAVLNVVLAWALVALEAPLTLLIWGPIVFAFNTVALVATDQVMGSLHIDGLWPALVGAAVISLADLLIEALSRSFRTGLTRSA